MRVYHLIPHGYSKFSRSTLLEISYIRKRKVCIARFSFETTSALWLDKRCHLFFFLFHRRHECDVFGATTRSNIRRSHRSSLSLIPLIFHLFFFFFSSALFPPLCYRSARLKQLLGKWSRPLQLKMRKNLIYFLRDRAVIL